MANETPSFNRNYHRRRNGHDYRAPWKYHITLSKSASAPVFGTLSYDPANPAAATIIRSTLGNIIAREILTLSKYHQQVQVYQFAIMPDHIHILLRVMERMEKPLGYVILNLMAAIARQYSVISGIENAAPIFEKGYNDRIIYPHRSLDAVFRYIRENPARLAFRRSFPDFFKRISKVCIAGRYYETYGNIQLLENPFKEQVVVHRRNSAEENSRLSDLWRHTAAGGGVLVSPFISPAEKNIRRQAEELGGRIILITDVPFPERFKPALRDFDLCCQGRLLMIAPESSAEESMPPQLSRERCMAMNALATSICSRE